MKRRFTTFIILFFLLSTTVLQAKDVLLTTNKSGTHFTLYSIQYLTQKPIQSFSGAGFQHFHTNLEVDQNKVPILHTHLPNDISSLKKDDKLIFLTRSPIELFLRMFGYEQSCMLLETLIYNLPYDSNIKIKDPVHPERLRPINHAFNSIHQLISSYRAYDKYCGKNKMIIYFEDLVTQPSAVMEGVIAMLDESQFFLDKYKKNIDDIRNASYFAYVSQWNLDPSYIVNSDGKNPLYYQEKQTVKEIDYLRELTMKIFPEEYISYINRFLFTKITHNTEPN